MPALRLRALRTRFRPFRPRWIGTAPATATDPNPRTVTIRDSGHTATIRDSGHTATLRET